MPDLQLLVPFAQTVVGGSYVAAATRLHVTPSAVSKSILKLERELGVRLFNRTTRKLNLTHEGEEFYQRISPLLAGMDEAIASLSNKTREPAGLVRVSVSRTFAQSCLLPIISDFFAACPAIKLDITVTEDLPKMVEDGIDVCIHPQQRPGSSHVSRVLCDYPVILVASPEYLRRKGVPRTPQDLADHDCVGLRFPYGETVAWDLVRIRKSPGSSKQQIGERFTHVPHPSLTIGEQIDTSLTAVLYGAGIVPAAVPTALPYLQSGRLKLILPDFRTGGSKDDLWRIHLSYSHRQGMPTKVRAFIDFLVERFRSADFNSEMRDAYVA